MIPDLRLTVTGVNEAIARADAILALYMTRIRDALTEWATKATDKITAGHPPGGPHPADGGMPEYGTHAYIDRTGRLTRSVGFTVESWTGKSVRLLVFAVAPYAEAVEIGTPHSRPYPFFWPVIYEMVPLLHDQLATAIAGVFEELGAYGRS